MSATSRLTRYAEGERRLPHDIPFTSSGLRDRGYRAQPVPAVLLQRYCEHRPFAGLTDIIYGRAVEGSVEVDDRTQRRNRATTRAVAIELYTKDCLPPRVIEKTAPPALAPSTVP